MLNDDCSPCKNILNLIVVFFVNNYRIAGFLREDFNIALGTIRNIKICIVFVNVVICWSRDICVECTLS